MITHISIYKKLLFIFIIIIGVFIFLEACERISVYYHYWRDVKKFKNPLMELVSPLDRREYVLKKNSSFVTNNGIVYEINGKGLRGKEYAYEKPKDTYRILMLGDSYLFGWGLQWQDTLTVKLEKLLNESDIHSNKRHEVINGGIYGYNTVQEEEFFKKEGSNYNPDAVVLYFVMNDMEPQWNAPRNPRYEYEYCRSWFMDHLVRRLNDHLVKTKKFSEPPFVVYRSRQSTQYLRAFDKEVYRWNSCKKAILDLASLLKEKRIDFYIVIVPAFTEDFKNYPFYRIHSAVKNIDQNLRVLDLMDIFKDKDSKQFRVNSEDAHPNAKANDLIAQKIRSFMQRNYGALHKVPPQ